MRITFDILVQPRFKVNFFDTWKSGFFSSFIFKLHLSRFLLFEMRWKVADYDVCLLQEPMELFEEDNKGLVQAGLITWFRIISLQKKMSILDESFFKNSSSTTPSWAHLQHAFEISSLRM